MCILAQILFSYCMQGLEFGRLNKYFNMIGNPPYYKGLTKTIKQNRPKIRILMFKVRHWKENLPSQEYAVLEGKVFQLNNFTINGFSFQLVFSLKIGRFYHPS